MKKPFTNFTGLLGIIVVSIVVLSGCTPNVTKDTQTKEQIKTPETSMENEQDFNESGRAKATEDESDLWQVFEDKNAGITLKYPGNVTLNDSESNMSPYLAITSSTIDSLGEAPSGYDTQSALKNRDLLESGKTAENLDWPLKESVKLRKIDGTNAQEFMVLARFDVCNVVFSRKLYFFNGEYQIVLNLIGPVEKIKESSPQYFKTNESNCGGETIWDWEKQPLFLKDLQDGKGSEVAQEWFDVFDKIVDTIEIQENAPTNSQIAPSTSTLLQGKWTSTEDQKFVIEFKDDMKIDYYEGKKMGEGKLQIFDKWPIAGESNETPSGKYLAVAMGEEGFEYEVSELTEASLVLINLPRGNTLMFKR